MPDNDTKAAEKSSGSSGSSGSELSRRGGGGDSLESEKGQTSIADSVVTKVAGLAAGEVAGVYELGGAASRAHGHRFRVTRMHVGCTPRGR